MNPVDWLRSIAPARRWYADKTRTIERVSIAWSAPLTGAGNIELVVANIEYTDDSASLYTLPWDVVASDDAIASPEFTTWLVDSIIGRTVLPSGLTWNRLSQTALARDSREAGRLLGVEQSNTSIRYGNDLLIKVNRRLTSGASPEAELAAVIAKAADPTFAAPIHGLLTLSGITDEPVCLAVCAQFISNLGDAWSHLGHLMTEPFDRSGLVGNEIDAIADVTAAMHIGLTSDPWRRDVAPEAITRVHIDGWESAARAALDKLLDELEARDSKLPESARQLVELLPDALPTLKSQLSGYQSLQGTHRIRIHGDYHLGQLLRKSDGGYVVVDFDGEPNRTLAERREKYSALRDVAGMLRSFAYARGTAEKASSTDARSAEWRLWERTVRERYLTVYRSRLGLLTVPLIPDSAEEIRLALSALELEKAIYECGYELSNRPDWLWLPLSRLVSSG